MHLSFIVFGRLPYSLQMPTANDPQPKWDSWQRLHPLRLLRISFHAWCECRWRTALVWQRVRSFQFAVRCFVNFKMKRQRTCKNPITEDVIARRESGLLPQKGSVEGSANCSLHLSPKWLLLHKSCLEGSANCAFTFISQSPRGVKVAWIVDMSHPYRSSPQKTTHHVVAVGVFLGLI